MTKMSTKTSVSFKKDPATDRQAMVSAMKGFKGSKFPSNPFKDSKPATATDAFYTPHSGRVKK